MPLIPLFPLGSVLFPGGTLPLHIFEPRYKLMIGECIDREQPFGVVLIREGSEVDGGATPHDIGTTAHVSRVQRLPDGRMNLIAVGQQRFRILSLDNSRPYLAGEVSFIPREQPDDPRCDEAAARVAELFSRYFQLMLALGDQWTRRIGLPSRPAILADFVGGRLDVPPDVKQRLLEIDSVAACLTAELDILEKATITLAARVRVVQLKKYVDFGMMN